MPIIIIIITSLIIWLTYCTVYLNLFAIYRYGTTTFLWPPYHVLHTDLLGNDVTRLKEISALVRDPSKSGSGSHTSGDTTAVERPLMIVLPRQGRTAAETKKLLIDSNLWFL